MKVLQKLIKEHRGVVFNGDNYSEQWRTEAESRGLPNLRTTADALPALKQRKASSMFKKYKVLSKAELESRIETFAEQYHTQIGIEVDQMDEIARTMVLPAAIEHQRRLAAAVNESEKAGVDASNLRAELDRIASLIHKAQQDVMTLEQRWDAMDDEASLASIAAIRDRVLDAMDALRESVDELEHHVNHELWPLPGYRELLTVR